MKKLLTFIAIFGLGAITFALLNMYVLDPKEVTTETPDIQETPVINETSVLPANEIEQELPETTTTITPDGSLLDGPFIIFDSEGNKTEATVEIVRSPEETLLQFSDFGEELSLSSRIYFSTDKQATKFFNLSPAAMATDVYIYGVPLDADLSTYKYILIYDEQMDETEYYAQIQ